jgi:hypothetical protein
MVVKKFWLLLNVVDFVPVCHHPGLRGVVRHGNLPQADLARIRVHSCVITDNTGCPRKNATMIAQWCGMPAKQSKYQIKAEMHIHPNIAISHLYHLCLQCDNKNHNCCIVFPRHLVYMWFSWCRRRDKTKGKKVVHDHFFPMAWGFIKVLGSEGK